MDGSPYVRVAVSVGNAPFCVGIAGEGGLTFAIVYFAQTTMADVGNVAEQLRGVRVVRRRCERNTCPRASASLALARDWRGTAG